MSALEPRVQATRYTVTCMPPEASPDAHCWALHVELGRDGAWSVTDGHMYLDAECDWRYTRREAGSHTLGQALTLAEAVAPHYMVNGLTPDAALARIERLKAVGQ